MVKEATVNIVKHSNANVVNIKCVNSGDGTGIGLENIRARVESLNGIINIDNKNSFKIFVSIPKGELS